MILCQSDNKSNVLNMYTRLNKVFIPCTTPHFSSLSGTQFIFPYKHTPQAVVLIRSDFFI